MNSLKSVSPLSFSLLNHFSFNVTRSFPSLLCTLSAPTQPSEESTSVFDYLITKFKFSETQCVYLSKHVSATKSLQKTLNVLKFFQQIGFSEHYIQSIVTQTPRILFSGIDKTLKPKIEFFQRLGFGSSELAKLISRNPAILTASLNKTLVPSVEVIRKSVGNEKDLIPVLLRSSRALSNYPKLQSSAAFFGSCGIVGSQLLMLLKREARLFTAHESKLRNLVSRAVEMGFHINSRMLVHALHTLGGISLGTIRRKLELLQSFGFSRDESMEMFRRAPTLLRTSEKKLKYGMEFYLHTMMLPNSALIYRPSILMYSLENRSIPRYKVLQLLVSKNLIKKHPSLSHFLQIPEDMFLNDYILRFRDNAEDLLEAYKGQLQKAASK